MTIALSVAVAITCAVALVAIFGMARFHQIATSWQREFTWKHRALVVAQAEHKQALIELAKAQKETRLMRSELDTLLEEVSFDGVLPVDYFRQRLSDAARVRRFDPDAGIFGEDVSVWEINLPALGFRIAQSRIDLGESEHVRRSVAMHAAAEFTEHLRDELAKKLEAKLKEDCEWLKARKPAPADASTSTLRLTASSTQ